mgnify:CR=1 FL=1
MADISELEHRITTALDRISAGVEKLSRPPEPGPEAPAPEAGETGAAAEAGEVARLTDELEAERTANAQLEERIAALKQQQADELEAERKAKAELEQRLAELKDQETKELEAERAAKAQLEQRIAALKQEQAEELEELRSENLELDEQVRAAHNRNRALKRKLDELRIALRDLREAGESGLPDAEQINKALHSELEGLRALREGDREELDNLLGALKPLVAEEEKADA